MDSGSIDSSRYPGGPSAPVSPADAAACASLSEEVRLLAARLDACAGHAAAAAGGLARMELQGWQSPAGNAYRRSLAGHAAALRRSQFSLEDAATAVRRHARAVLLAAGHRAA